jgi:hypothetical protein
VVTGRHAWAISAGGSNSSFALPGGSSSKVGVPLSPITVSWRRLAPSVLHAWTSLSRSSTSPWMRVPAAGNHVLHRVRRERLTAANCGATEDHSLKPVPVVDDVDAPAGAGWECRSAGPLLFRTVCRFEAIGGGRLEVAGETVPLVASTTEPGSAMPSGFGHSLGEAVRRGTGG